MTTYVTFGQNHRHEIDGKIFDKDCVAVIQSNDRQDGRNKAFMFFSKKFCMEYFNEEWKEDTKMQYFPRGYVKVPK